MTGPLNLADADLKGFEALDAGRYDAEVFEITMDAVKNTSGTGKMPAGTPMMKIQFRVMNPRINGEPIDQDRRAFASYVIPPKTYDKKKSATMKGMIARFFIATGDPEETVLAKEFDPDFEDYKGRPVSVTLGREPKKDAQGNVIEGEFNNPVKGVKPAGAAVESGGLL